MKKSVYRVAALFISLCLLLSITGCSEEGFRVGTGSFPDEFYSHITYGDFLVYVNDDFIFDANDVSVVIEDESIIDISFEVEETRLFNAGITYQIRCLSPGATTFYFEVPSLSLKTEAVKITVLENMKSIYFKNKYDITLLGLKDSENREFKVEKYEHDSLTWAEELVFVSEDPQIATIKYDAEADGFQCRIDSVGIGETYIYIQTKDGSVQSNKLKVIVEEEKIKEEETAPSPEPSEDNSRTVYTTPYGKKYHYSQSCAGENASATTEEKAKDTHAPCKKCVH